MIVREEHGADGVWVVKSASSPEEAARLMQEAAQLQRAAHPGVVEIGPFLRSAPSGAEVGAAAAGVNELRTRWAGRSLGARAALPVPELCGLGVAVATVLADLHDLGVLHGAVDADHILIGEDGRPVLCGFGSSRSTEDGDPLADVRDLADTLSACVGTAAPRPLLRVLAGAAGGRRVPSARAFARQLDRAQPNRRLPAPTPQTPTAARLADPAPFTLAPARPASASTTPPSAPARSASDATGATGAGPGGASEARAGVRPPRRSLGRAQRDGARRIPGRARRDGARSSPGQPWRDEGRRIPGRAWREAVRERRGGLHRRPGVRVAGMVAAVLVVGTVFAIATAAHRRPVVSADSACPAIDLGCAPLTLRNGTFRAPAGTFATGVRDAVVVLGRWTCGPGSLPAALDPRTGQVWAWLDWALPADTVRATAVTTEGGARSLRVLPGTSGCDRLQVIGADGSVTVVRPGEASRD